MSKIENKTYAKWAPDLGNGYYKNPIIHADYSDPDVVRVGDDYFMVASSFNMSPCLPVLHSKDLVNWTIINHVFEKIPYEKYKLPCHGEGVWAPSIRYHNGEFWVFFSTPDEGVFMSKTTDPFGAWSPLHLVKKVKGWIDPCPFWDDDGHAYLVHAFAKSRIGFKSKLQICKMKRDGTVLLDDGKVVFDGTVEHPTIEGTKMYKRNDYYYIFAPAGGVAAGWQTVLRSTAVYGPYEDQIVLHQGKTKINGPHQGGWVETNAGESWFIHFQDKGAYGRITHLQPMWWEEDWPIIGVGDGEIKEPVLEWKKPHVTNSSNQVIIPQTSDDFDHHSLGLQWQWRANYNKEWYALKNNRLRLFAHETVGKTLYDTPQILTQKFPARMFTATTCVTFNPLSDEVTTGLFVGGYSYGGLKLKRLGEGLSLILYQGKDSNGYTTEVEEVVGHVESSTVYLRVHLNENVECQFSYSVDHINYHLIEPLVPVTKGHWIGAIIGLFCMIEGKDNRADYADYSWFTIE
jgi:beta-xylosidase